MNRIWDKEKNVYQAGWERMEFIWTRFERVYLSLSGGKDSGVMMNLCLDYMRANPEIIKGRKLGIQIMDNEANYEYSVEFMQRIIEKNIDMLDVFWCCLPITLPCTVSAYHIDWQCWGIVTAAAGSVQCTTNHILPSGKTITFHSLKKICTMMSFGMVLPSGIHKARAVQT